MEGANVQVNDNGSVVYRASALGGCIKALAAERQGYKKIEGQGQSTLPLIFAEGHLHEQAIVEKLRGEGWVIEDQQLEVTLLLSGNVSVVGHIDGVVRSLSSPREGLSLTIPCLLEIKTMGDQQFKDWMNHKWETPGLVQKYRWQLSIYMNALSLSGLVIVKNRNSGQLCYEILAEPFYSLAQIRQRVELIEKSSLDSLKCDAKDFWCPYKYLEEPDDTELIINELLDDYCRMERELQVQKKEIEELLKQTRADIGKLTSEQTQETAKYKALWYTPERTEIDKDLLSEWLSTRGEMIEHFYRTMPGRPVLRITSKEPESPEPEGVVAQAPRRGEASPRALPSTPQEDT